jgi:FkbM family methyltransferase
VLRPGDVAVDAGAYKGGYAYWMRHAVGTRGAVLAFEPQPELATYLRETVVAFGWDNVHVEQAALSASEGEAALHVPGHAPSQRGSLVVERAGARVVPVRIGTLDAFLAGRALPRPIRLLKLDVEGHEMEALRGAERTLLRDRPLLLFECEERFGATGSVERVLAYVGSLGYRGGFFWRGEMVDARAFDLEVHQVEGTRPYANNFAFVQG